MKTERTKKETLASTSSLIQDVLNQKPALFLALKYPEKWLRYNRALDRLQAAANEQPRTWKTRVYWYWGPTGAGKTRLAHLLTRNRAWTSGDNKAQWFDGYVGQKDVIFDDLSIEDNIPRGLFLRLMDRYAMRVPVKGGFVNWQPKRVFITSNFKPHDLYQNDPAVLRRITETFLFPCTH